MANLSLPVNIKKLLADQLTAQQAGIIANTNAKADETKQEVINKATETQNAIVADGDITQAKLDTISTVNGGISTDVQAVNTHVTERTESLRAEFSGMLGPRKMAPDLDRLVNVAGSSGLYSASVDVSTGGYVALLDATGRFELSNLALLNISGSVDVRLTIDGVVIWDCTVGGVHNYMLGYGTAYRDAFICEQSLKFEASSPDADILFVYDMRPIL